MQVLGTSPKGYRTTVEHKNIEYRITPAGERTVRFTKPNGEQYLTTSTGCTCPHYRFRAPGGGCKHQQIARQLNMIE